MYAYKRKKVARALVVAFCATAIVGAALPASSSSTQGLTNFSKSFVIPSAADTMKLVSCVVGDKDLCQPDTILTVHVTSISGSAFCTLLTGTWCDGPLPLPQPNQRVLADTRQFEATSPL